MRFGTDEPAGYRYGTQQVSKLYFGSAEVWSAAPVEPEEPPPDPGDPEPGQQTAWGTTGVYRGSWDPVNRIRMFESPDGINRPITGPIVAFGGRGATTWSQRRNQLNTPLNDFTPRCVAGDDVLSLSVAPYPGKMTGGQLAPAAAGDFDSHWEEDAERILFYGYDADHIIIRPAWEMNGAFYNWTIRGDASAANRSSANVATNITNFKAMWVRMVNIYRDALPGVRFDYCPLRGQMTKTEMNSCYPGDDYVDFIGLDCYNWDYSSNVATRWNTIVGAATTFVGLQWQRDLADAQNKLCSFPEWGLEGQSGSGDDPYYIEHIIDWFDALGADGLLGYHCYFEKDASSENNAHQLHNYDGDPSYTGTHLAGSDIPEAPTNFGDSLSTAAFDAKLKN